MLSWTRFFLSLSSCAALLLSACAAQPTGVRMAGDMSGSYYAPPSAYPVATPVAYNGGT